MKNLAKFLLFVLLVSAGISWLYDYRLRHGDLNLLSRRTPEKYTLASAPSVDSTAVASLEALNRERRTLVSSVIPSVVAVKTSKKIAIRRQYGLDPFEFFFRNQRPFRNPNDEALVQNSLGSGVIVTNEGHIITNNHVVDQVDEIEVQLSDGRTKKARLVGADSQVYLGGVKIDNPVRTALESLLKQGRIIRGSLGIQTRPLQPGQNGAGGEGVFVDEVVPGSPAAEAHMQKGDIIRKFNGHEVKNLPALRSLIAQAGLNKKVELEIDREDKPVKLTAEIRE